MTSKQFTAWLKGFFEISNQDHITKEQLEKIKRVLFSIEEEPEKIDFPIYNIPSTPFIDPYKVTCKK